MSATTRCSQPLVAISNHLLHLATTRCSQQFVAISLFNCEADHLRTSKTSLKESGQDFRQIAKKSLFKVYSIMCFFSRRIYCIFWTLWPSASFKISPKIQKILLAPRKNTKKPQYFWTACTFKLTDLPVNRWNIWVFASQGACARNLKVKYLSFLRPSNCARYVNMKYLSFRLPTCLCSEPKN